jgi:hypothetical protein
MTAINGSGIYMELVFVCPSLLKEGHRIPSDSSTALMLRTSH